jgi:CBS domain-containing protein
MRETYRQETARREGRQLREIMRRHAVVVKADTPLGEAARRMRTLNLTRLPVCDGPKLVGLITARDLTMRATAEGLDPQASTVREVMTREIACIEENQDVEEAVTLMLRHNLLQLFVVDRQQRLLGIVCFSDLYAHRQKF